MEGQSLVSEGSQQRRLNRYAQIVEMLFLSRYTEGATSIPFEREEFASIARQLGIRLPKNLGDVIYSFRFRATFPDTINNTAPEGLQWTIRLKGRGRYAFDLVRPIVPNTMLVETKIPDGTPSIGFSGRGHRVSTRWGMPS
jgi:hypothetical protein